MDISEVRNAVIQALQAEFEAVGAVDNEGEELVIGFELDGVLYFAAIEPA